jgi:hypothetical protein
MTTVALNGSRHLLSKQAVTWQEGAFTVALSRQSLALLLVKRV